MKPTTDYPKSEDGAWAPFDVLECSADANENAIPDGEGPWFYLFTMSFPGTSDCPAYLKKNMAFFMSTDDAMDWNFHFVFSFHREHVAGCGIPFGFIFLHELGWKHIPGPLHNTWRCGGRS